MSHDRFAACLFDELQKLRDKRQEILDAQATLTQERGIIQRRIDLLRELLILEGADVHLTGIFDRESAKRPGGLSSLNSGRMVP